MKQVAANYEAKEAIGRAAARLVKSGDVLLLSDGSTTFHLASCLGGCGPITVYTNSIAMIEEFERFPHIRLYIIGGEYHANMSYVGGSLTGRMLEGIVADMVFMGTDAIDRAGRCLARDHDIAETARAMLGHGRRRILLADGSKVRSKASVVYGSLRDFDLWITSSPESPELRRLSRYTRVKNIAAPGRQ